MELITTCNAHGCSHRATAFAYFANADGGASEAAFCTEHASILEIDSLLLRYQYAIRQSPVNRLEECVLRAVIFVSDSDQYLVLLSTKNSDRHFVFATGYIEAAWIGYIIRRVHYPTKPTHQLIIDIVSALDASLVEGVLHDCDRDTGAFRCLLAMHAEGGEQRICCRISDAVAICHFASVPLMIDTAFLTT